MYSTGVPALWKYDRRCKQKNTITHTYGISRKKYFSLAIEWVMPWAQSYTLCFVWSSHFLLMHPRSFMFSTILSSALLYGGSVSLLNYVRHKVIYQVSTCFAPDALLRRECIWMERSGLSSLSSCSS